MSGGFSGSSDGWLKKGRADLSLEKRSPLLTGLLVGKEGFVKGIRGQKIWKDLYAKGVLN